MDIYWGFIIPPTTDPIGHLRFRNVWGSGLWRNASFSITEYLCPATKSDKCSCCKCQRLQRIYCIERKRTEGFIYKHDASFGLKMLNWDSVLAVRIWQRNNCFNVNQCVFTSVAESVPNSLLRLWHLSWCYLKFMDILDHQGLETWDSGVRHYLSLEINYFWLYLFFKEGGKKRSLNAILLICINDDPKINQIYKTLNKIARI